MHSETVSVKKRNYSRNFYGANSLQTVLCQAVTRLPWLPCIYNPLMLTRNVWDQSSLSHQYPSWLWSWSMDADKIQWALAGHPPAGNHFSSREVKCHVQKCYFARLSALWNIQNFALYENILAATQSIWAHHVRMRLIVSYPWSQYNR